MQAVFKEYAINFGIPTKIPSKKIDYDSEKIGGNVTVEPVSTTQIYIHIWQEGGEDFILMTYNPAKKTTHVTECYILP